MSIKVEADPPQQKGQDPPRAQRVAGTFGTKAFSASTRTLGRDAVAHSASCSGVRGAVCTRKPRPPGRSLRCDPRSTVVGDRTSEVCLCDKCRVRRTHHLRHFQEHSSVALRATITPSFSRALSLS